MSLDLTNWLLSTTDYRADGVFSELHCDDELFSVTLEHAFAQSDSSFAPKLPRGATYTCKVGTGPANGMHVLEHYNQGRPFAAYEVMGVPGHSGILFHVGNTNKDSDGCLLMGEKILTLRDSTWMIFKSQDTFVKFMQTMDGIEEFTLRVE
jgi:hypothetical protein